MIKKKVFSTIQKYLPYFLAVISSTAMMLNLNERDRDTLDGYFSEENLTALGRLMNDLRVSMHSNYGFDGLIVLILLCILYKKVLPISNKRLKIWTTPFAVLFGLSMVFGYSFDKTSSWDLVFGNLRNLVKSTIAITGYAILFYIGICGLYLFIENRINRPNVRLVSSNSKLLGYKKN